MRLWFLKFEESGITHKYLMLEEGDGENDLPAIIRGLEESEELIRLARFYGLSIIKPENLDGLTLDELKTLLANKEKK